MYFDSLTALWLMEGHGLYVWSAYGICLLVMAALVILPLRRQRQLMRGLGRRSSRRP
jgi:heme exporter protein D